MQKYSRILFAGVSWRVKSVSAENCPLHIHEIKAAAVEAECDATAADDDSQECNKTLEQPVQNHLANPSLHSLQVYNVYTASQKISHLVCDVAEMWTDFCRASACYACRSRYCFTNSVQCR